MYGYVRRLFSTTLAYAVIARAFHLGESWADDDERRERHDTRHARAA